MRSGIAPVLILGLFENLEGPTEKEDRPCSIQTHRFAQGGGMFWC